jgi:hypothetical protein
VKERSHFGARSRGRRGRDAWVVTEGLKTVAKSARLCGGNGTQNGGLPKGRLRDEFSERPGATAGGLAMGQVPPKSGPRRSLLTDSVRTPLGNVHGTIFRAREIASHEYGL